MTLFWNTTAFLKLDKHGNSCFPILIHVAEFVSGSSGIHAMIISIYSPKLGYKSYNTNKEQDQILSNAAVDNKITLCLFLT